MGKYSPGTRRIALNGILGALAVLCLLLAAILPTNKLSLYALSSFFISAVIIEGGTKAGWLFYAATSLLALIIVPDKLTVVLPYAVFFGIYGIIKCYIERLNSIAVEYVLKFIYFNICVAVALILFKSIFGYILEIKISIWIIIACLQLVFFVYDYVYTLVVNYYRNKVRPKLK